MARPQKEGIDYFSLDVGFFSDRKIKILQARYGADGVIVYLYILCEIYKDKGYYLKIDDDFNYTASADLNMSYEKIGQIINFLLERSLFDDTLFKSDKVLTSHGIQMRFQQAIKSRATKKSVEVDEKFWVLKKSETEGFIHYTHFLGFSEINTDKSENNPCLSEEKLHKVKESKVKDSKENKSIFAAFATGDLLDALIDFEKMRITIKKPLNDRACKLLLTELDKLTNDDVIKIKILEQSILHNWATVYPIKQNDSSAKNGKGEIQPTKFSNFKQTDFDYKAIEARALGKGKI